MVMNNLGVLEMRALIGTLCCVATVALPLLADDDYVAQIRNRKSAWLEKAEDAKPVLRSRKVRPVRLVKAVPGERSFQGWRVEPVGAVESALNRSVGCGESLVFDFGEHLVGYLGLKVGEGAGRADSPVRMKLVYAEMPSELGLSFEPFTGGISRSWLPDEVVFFDEVPSAREISRRHAFRYVKITVESACPFSLKDLSVRAVTSADEAAVRPLATNDALLAKIDAIAVRTLRDCMQTTLEDGPKRDRRLWIGDLRMQALVNYVTFRNYGIVRRALYHFAGTADERGLVSSDAYERPALAGGQCHILDYTALFPAIVQEYLDATGDRDAAEDLWPLCARQMEIVLETVGEDGLFRDEGKWWCFIDWNGALDRQASEQGVIICGLNRIVTLARALGREKEAERFAGMAGRMKSAARQALLDPSRGVFVSGSKRQVSQMSQAWMVLAGVVTGDEARRCLRAARADASAERPRTPYACHYLVEALLLAGLDAEADGLLRAYWGGMAERGADTFWEAFDPKDDFISPYGNILLNSACHAWSCGPAYLLRKGSVGQAGRGRGKK